MQTYMRINQMQAYIIICHIFSFRLSVYDIYWISYYILDMNGKILIIIIICFYKYIHFSRFKLNSCVFTKCIILRTLLFSIQFIAFCCCFLSLASLQWLQKALISGSSFCESQKILPYSNILLQGINVIIIDMLFCRQVALADVIIVNKLDLVSAKQLSDLIGCLRYSTQLTLV